MVNGFTCRIAAQNASTVCPDRLRPAMSVIVIEIIKRHIAARCCCRFLRRHGRTFGIERVKDRFNQQEVDTRLQSAHRIVRGIHSFR